MNLFEKWAKDIRDKKELQEQRVVQAKAEVKSQEATQPISTQEFFQNVLTELAARKIITAEEAKTYYYLLTENVHAFWWEQLVQDEDGYTGIERIINALAKDIASRTEHDIKWYLPPDRLNEMDKVISNALCESCPNNTFRVISGCKERPRNYTFVIDFEKACKKAAAVIRKNVDAAKQELAKRREAAKWAVEFIEQYEKAKQAAHDYNHFEYCQDQKIIALVGALHKAEAGGR